MSVTALYSPYVRWPSEPPRVFLTLSLIAPAAAEDRRAAIESVIEGQIEAFSRNDGDAAFAFASPEIQRIFGNPGRFMETVRAGFAPVYRPRNYAFEPPIVADGLPAQPVRLIGPDGRGFIALYRMEEQPEGSWRIAEVTLHLIAERGI